MLMGVYFGSLNYTVSTGEQQTLRQEAGELLSHSCICIAAQTQVQQRTMKGSQEKPEQQKKWHAPATLWSMQFTHWFQAELTLHMGLRLSLTDKLTSEQQKQRKMLRKHILTSNIFSLFLCMYSHTMYCTVILTMDTWPYAGLDLKVILQGN